MCTEWTFCLSMGRGESMDDVEEELLSGGNTSALVVRVGKTVRKPWFEGALAVLEYMRILRQRGVDLPEPLGRDAQGRMVTEFVDGVLAMEQPALSNTQLAKVGSMIRAIHDASEGLDADALGLRPALIPVSAPDLVCHGDLAPWNLLIGERWMFIDWDGAAASTRLWDLAYSGQAFTLNDAAADPTEAAAALRAFVDGYRADPAIRAALATTLVQRTWAMHDLLRDAHHEGVEPWRTMFAEGHGEHWRAVARFVQQHQAVWDDAIRAQA